MTKLLKIAAFMCVTACSNPSYASDLILEFEKIDCKKDGHLLECDTQMREPADIAQYYGTVAYALDDVVSAYHLARFAYNERKKGAVVGPSAQTILGLVGEAARLGYGPAQLTYAKYLQSSQGDDEVWALHYFLRAHENGLGEGTVAAATIFYEWGLYKDAFPLMEAAAKSGNPKAQYLTGMMLAHGQKDVSGGLWSELTSVFDFGKSARARTARPEAIKWLQRAAKQNHPHAKTALLELFEADDREGKATFPQLMALGDACDTSKTNLYDSKNRWDAIAYYQRAAHLAAKGGNRDWEAEARFQAGVVLNTPYLEGEGVHFRWTQHHDLAESHFLIAGALGHKRAKMCLEQIKLLKTIDPSNYDIFAPENQNDYAVQQMCGFFPSGWNPVKALEAGGTCPFPMVPQIGIQ